MISNQQRTRRTTHLKKVVLSLSLATSLTSAFVIPSQAQAASLSSSSSLSSSRKSINFGPNLPSAYHSLDKPSSALLNFNAKSAGLLSTAAVEDCAGETEIAKCVGGSLARTFLETLHPTAEFRLVDGYLTKNTGVFHAHFVQEVNGIPIANGNLNVNVGPTGEIVSYGDSSFAATQKSIEGDFRKKVASWAGVIEKGAQVVLGAASGLDQGPQPVDILEEFSSPPLVPSAKKMVTRIKHEIDPRHGLLSFLALQTPSSAFAELLLSTPRPILVDAFKLVEHQQGKHSHTIHGVPTTVAPVKASLAYVHDGEDLKLAWKYEVHTDDNQYEAYVSAERGVSGSEETLMVVDWVRDFRPTGGEVGFDGLSANGQSTFVRPSPTFKIAQMKVDRNIVEGDLKALKPAYRVFPWGINAPDEGKRELLTGSTIELDSEASPAGWHTIPAAFKGGKPKSFTDTRGNNVYAQDNPDGGNSFEHNYRPSGGANLTFDFPLGWPKAGTPLDPVLYVDASITELFYTNNEIHDLFYTYGFDEVSGNFQDYNFGRGGAGDDAVQANSQDGSGTNNANFATPPDGQRPRMRMYTWTGTQPYRDGDFEAGIVIHEYSHGISTRLTGGPANSGCLGWGEAGGMGEGWGDFFATMIRMHSAKDVEFNMGEWASSRLGGIRNYPYSRNATINPDSYKSLDKPGYWGVHAIGEVWAEILFEVAELLIKEHGFHSGLFPPAQNSTDTDFYDTKYKTKVPKYGNTLAVQLVVDGMKLQPCRPSFQDARDAILAADKVLTGGDNACLIWKGMSKRGLGPGAMVVGSTPWGGGVRTEDYSVPKSCK